MVAVGLTPRLESLCAKPVVQGSIPGESNFLSIKTRLTKERIHRRNIRRLRDNYIYDDQPFIMFFFCLFVFIYLLQ